MFSLEFLDHRSLSAPEYTECPCPEECSTPFDSLLAHSCADPDSSGYPNLVVVQSGQRATVRLDRHCLDMMNVCTRKECSGDLAAQPLAKRLQEQQPQASHMGDILEAGAASGPSRVIGPMGASPAI